MNIFLTDYSPIECAINLDDKRLKHMNRENLELLAITIHSAINTWVIPFPLWGDDRREEPTFLYNHPISKWIRKDKANTYWLYQHTQAIFDEYNYRFNEVSPIYHLFEKIKPFISETERKPKSFHNSSLYKQLPIIEAYRATMINKWTITDKIKPVRFTKREPPKWFIKNLEI